MFTVLKNKPRSVFFFYSFMYLFNVNQYKNVQTFKNKSEVLAFLRERINLRRYLAIMIVLNCSTTK